MELLVVRHAIAEDRVRWAAGGRPDEERPLTDRGRERMKRNARGIVAVSPRIDLVATSPFVRATETAALLAKAQGRAPIVEVDALASGGSADELLRWLRQRDEDERIALVGHEPDLGELVAWLVAGAEAAAIAIKKGGACLVAFDGLPECGRGELRWFLPPALLRRLA